MSNNAFQDYYLDKFSHCYGCGRLNTHGLQIKSRWDGEESVAFYTPKPYHLAAPGFVYGGLIASLIDCHGTGTAAAATYRAQGRPMDSDPALRFVTAAIHVDYLAPTPMGVSLEIRAEIEEITQRKVIVRERVIADNQICAKGRVIAVPMPRSMADQIQNSAEH